VAHNVRERNKEALKAFGTHLQKLRIKNGFSQEDLADRANIAYSSVNKLENGNLNTSISTIFDLAKALGVHKKEMLDFEN